MPSRYLPTWIVSGVSDVVILLCILENTSSQPVSTPIWNRWPDVSWWFGNFGETVLSVIAPGHHFLGLICRDNMIFATSANSF